MRHGYLSAVTAAMMLNAGNQAFADHPETQSILAMFSLIEFITENSSLDYAGEALPVVMIVTEDELQRRYRSSETPVTSLAGDQSTGRVSALYDRLSKTIYLAEVNSITGPGLFHELVHFLQDANGKDDLFVSHPVCLEAEAYELQAIWQSEKEIDIASKPEYGFVMTLYGICNDAKFSWVDG